MANTKKVVLSPQCAAILSELKTAPRNSLYLRRRCYTMALGTRICELRKIGFNIQTELVPLHPRRRDSVHVALYTLRRRRTSSARQRRAG